MSAPACYSVGSVVGLSGELVTVDHRTLGIYVQVQDGGRYVTALLGPAEAGWLHQVLGRAIELRTAGAAGAERSVTDDEAIR